MPNLGKRASNLRPRQPSPVVSARTRQTLSSSAGGKKGWTGITRNGSIIQTPPNIAQSCAISFNLGASDLQIPPIGRRTQQRRTVRFSFLGCTDATEIQWFQSSDVSANV